MDRRHFLKNTGCLAIGFTLRASAFDGISPIAQDLPESLKRNPNIDSWIEVLGNGQVRIFTGKLELGQGIRTAIAQCAAEELDLPMKNVEVILADTMRTPNEGYTAGSGSIEQSAMAVRFASAAARQKLLDLAAQKMQVPVTELTMTDGVVQSTRAKMSFAEILEGKQITDKVQLPVNLKPKDKYKLVGKPIPRDDIKHMVRAQEVYIQDMRFTGMVYACVVRPPAYESRLEQLDEAGLQQAIKGVLKTVVNGSFVGVITQDEYQAVKAQHWLKQHSKWSAGKTIQSPTKFKEQIKTLPSKTEKVREKGSLTSDKFTLSAQYYKPYIMHGSIGPSCAIALYDNKTLHVWSHSQGAFPLREALRKLLNLPADQVQVTGVPGSGCYGHNGADDVAADAALLAMAYPGKHIKLQWTREDEHGWEPYGSAMLMELSAKLDSTGKITDWKYDVWSDTHSTRPGGNPENLLVSKYIAQPLSGKPGGFSGGAVRNSEPYYTIPNQLITGHFFEGPLRVSALRSLGAYANVFGIECFMDELAEKAGKDPFEFRLAQLNDERAIAVVHKLQQIVQAVPKEKGSGIGMAFARYKNSASYCAVAAKVRKQNNAIIVQKIWSVIDAGEVINIDGVINQTEGGMIQAASWTLLEEVVYDATHVTSKDWFSYPIMRITQAPEVEVVVLNQPNSAVMGAGEAAQGPAGAAIVNAVYRLTGKRVRSLPVKIT